MAGLRVKVNNEFLELEYPMKNTYALGGVREGYMEGGQEKGYVLVCGYKAFPPCLELIM